MFRDGRFRVLRRVVLALSLLLAGGGLEALRGRQPAARTARRRRARSG